MYTAELQLKAALLDESVPGEAEERPFISRLALMEAEKVEQARIEQTPETMLLSAYLHSAR